MPVLRVHVEQVEPQSAVTGTTAPWAAMVTVTPTTTLVKRALQVTCTCVALHGTGLPC